MPAPYTREELVLAAGISLRNLRYWVERGLVPPPVLRGMHTTYGEEHLVRLRVIARLRREGAILDAIRSRLAGLSPAELRALDPATPPEPRAPEPAPPPAPAPPSPAPALAPPAASAELPAVRWDRVELLPGLELHVRTDASPLLRRLAAEIHAHYAGAAVISGHASEA